ncbi:MAG: DNA polymerase III subunit alpha, partial [Phycisphaerales bacterium]|nr:DNA polymerase III subunit alpha [Phycisphaerales bacterium]
MKNDPQILAEFLRFKVIEGFKQNNFPLTREYLDRIESELEVVRQTKYEAYFLIVADLTDFMHKAGIRFVVRGSGCGSVIVWGLGISHPWLDPIRYKLPFERFLNPSRVTMPDLDIDIQDARRNEVIDYVVKKYGSERVARIINFGTMGARAAINDVARAMNLPDYQAVAAKITSQVSLSESLADKFLHDLARAHPRLLEFARRVEGKPRHTGKHAAGVVISPEDISNFMPLHYTGSPADRDKDEWEPTTSWDMYDVEAYGFLKMDFLGLKTLTVIDNCVKVINAIRSTRQQPLLDIDKIDRWDAKTWQLIADGKLSGVFQVERSYVRNFAKQMNMMRKDEWQLAIILSIIRPGMMDAGMTEVYLRRANELEAPTPPHPALEKTLCKNFGTFVFQEDLMWVCRDLAGFTLAEADTMRQAVAKKKADQLAKIKPKFAEGAKRLHGLTDEQIDAIWKQMATFAKYGFNQSHAAAYGLVITYMTAWLKANEPLVYMMCLINSESGVGDKEKGYNAKVAEYVEEARARGIEILSPCVKTSSAYCKLDLPRNAIRFGLSLVKKAGTSAVQWILEHCRQTDSFKDFILAGYQIREVAYEAYTDKKGREFPAGTEWKVYTQVGKQDIESLIQAGAFDVFDSDR